MDALVVFIEEEDDIAELGGLGNGVVIFAKLLADVIGVGKAVIRDGVPEIEGSPVAIAGAVRASGGGRRGLCAAGACQIHYGSVPAAIVCAACDRWRDTVALYLNAWRHRAEGDTEHLSASGR